MNGKGSRPRTWNTLAYRDSHDRAFPSKYRKAFDLLGEYMRETNRYHIELDDFADWLVNNDD